jgi:hypothetical protein
VLRIVEISDTLFFITSVHLLFTSMNLMVLLVPLERLGVMNSWRISYDKIGTLEGVITWAPEDKSR